MLTNRYSFLTTDVEDLVWGCITKAGTVDRICNSKCKSALLSHICFLRIERSVNSALYECIVSVHYTLQQAR